MCGLSSLTSLDIVAKVKTPPLERLLKGFSAPHVFSNFFPRIMGQAGEVMGVTPPRPVIDPKYYKESLVQSNYAT